MNATQRRYYTELRRTHHWTVPNALQGARALAWADSQGMFVSWEDDWHTGSHVDEYPDAYDAEPDSCETAELLDADGNLLGSLGCVDDADDFYRREVEVDLITEHWYQLHAAPGMLPLEWESL